MAWRSPINDCQIEDIVSFRFNGKQTGLAPPPPGSVIKQGKGAGFKRAYKDNLLHNLTPTDGYVPSLRSEDLPPRVKSVLIVVPDGVDGDTGLARNDGCDPAVATTSARLPWPRGR